MSSVIDDSVLAPPLLAPDLVEVERDVATDDLLSQIASAPISTDTANSNSSVYGAEASSDEIEGPPPDLSSEAAELPLPASPPRRVSQESGDVVAQEAEGTDKESEGMVSAAVTQTEGETGPGVGQDQDRVGGGDGVGSLSPSVSSSSPSGETKVSPVTKTASKPVTSLKPVVEWNSSTVVTPPTKAGEAVCVDTI